MAAKRVLSKSVDSFDEIFNIFYSKSEGLYNEIDNWSARINSLLELDIRKEDCSFSDVSKFLEFFNFLTGEFDLLYHGEIKVGEAIIDTRDGYSHDFLKGHLPKIEKQIPKKSKAMKDKLELVDTKFNSYGTTLDEGINSLKSRINELESNLPKKFKIITKETGSNTPYAAKICDEKTKTQEFLCRYKSIDFEKELRVHSWKKQKPQKRQRKTEVAESTTITTEKEAAVSSTKTAVSSSSKLAVQLKLPETATNDNIVQKAVQSTSRGRRGLIVYDEREDLSQATPASKLAVQLELPDTATNDNIVAETSIIQKTAAVSTTITTGISEKAVQSNSRGRRGLIVDDEREDLSQATPAGNDTSMSTALMLIQQSFEQNEVAPNQTTHDSFITAYPFTNSNAISIIKEDGSSKQLIGMMVRDYLISEEDNARRNFEHIVHSIKLFKELGWSFPDFFIGFEEMVMTVRKNLREDTLIHESREGRIVVNVLERKNSYRRARQFITTFSLQIFELFQLFTNARMMLHPLI